jgi:hypothetical protein
MRYLDKPSRPPRATAPTPIRGSILDVARGSVPDVA